MDIKTCINNVKLQIGGNSFIIQRKKEFLIFGNSIYKNGAFKASKIINYFPLNYFPPEENARNFLKNKKIHDDAAVMITNARIEHLAVKTMKFVTAVVSASILPDSGKISGENGGAINIILLINKNLSDYLLIKSYSWVVEAKVAALWDLDIRSNENDLNTGNNDDSLIVACTGESNEREDEELHMLIKKCVREATKESVLSCGYSKSVLDYIECEGIKIEDLVEAGMELVVGVEKSEELYEKLHKQILKSLEDLNVVSFIIAGIRLEEDYKKHRVEGINIDDDPAYLYSDEVFGMSVANQIAGTKAIFNFKRYDEEKPGIIGELGPVLDDVFAGLVAGCMSKIFEE